jgi:Secretion system C-terminal sorting domain
MGLVRSIVLKRMKMKGFYLLLVVLLTTSFAFGQAGNYRSRTSGTWATPGTWERDANSDGTFEESPSSLAPSSASGTVIIRNTHVVTVAAIVTVDQVTIQSGGTVTINSGVTVTLGTTNGTGDDIKVDVGGILNVNGTIQTGTGLPGGNNRLRVDGTVNNNGSFLNSTTAKFIFQAGSNYFHLFDGTTANAVPTASWATTSTVNITGFDVGGATVPTGLSQAFGNFVWNTPNMDQFLDLAGAPATVNGNFQVDDTGAAGFYWNQGGGGNTTLSIGGNFTLNGGVVAFIGQTGGTGSLTVSGNMILAGSSFFQVAEDVDALINIQGNLDISGSAIMELSAISAIADVNLAGNYTFSGGDILISSSPTGVANLNFTGTTTQVITSTLTPSGSLNYSVSASSIVSIPGNNFIAGNGTFILDGELQVGSTSSSGALHTGTASGNIRVAGTRTYSAGCTITYNGLAGQFIGDGHPTPPPPVDANTTVNNASGVSMIVGVPVTISANLTLINGDFNIGNGILNLAGDLNAGTNHITIGSGGSLTISGAGTMGTFPFPAGTQTFTNFTLDNSNGVTFESNVTITGVVTLTDGSLIVSGSNTLALDGTFAASGSGNLSFSNTSVFSIGGTGAFGSPRINSTNNTVGIFTFARSGGGTASLGSTLIVANTFNLTNGNFTNNGGLQMANGSTLIRNSNAQLLGNAPTDLNGQFYNVTYIGSTMSTGLELPNITDDMLGTLTINGGTVTLSQDIIVHTNLNLQSSSFDANGKNITLASTLGTLNKTAGTFVGGTGVLFVDNPAHNSNYTIVASSAPSFTNLTIVGGGTNTLTLPSSNVNISGNLINSGVINASTSTVTFSGVTTILGSNTTSLNNIIVSGTLVAPASTTLGISGNFVNNGTFNHNNGSVAFNGNTTISGSSASNFFTVSITGTLNAPSSTTLGIAGNLSNAGTFNHNGGTVALNGTVVAQSITGTALAFNNINVTNPVPPGVSINNTTRLNGVLTLNATGLFDADGSGAGVFIVSSTSQTEGGRIANLPTPVNFTGLVTIERYIHGQTGGDYRYLSVPITSGANVSLLRSSIFVTGNFSDRNTNTDNSNINNSGNTNASIFSYNSTTQAYIAVSGGGGTTAATALNSRTGYSAYNFNNGPVTASYRGNIEKGNVPITVSGTMNNFNLVPNPYPSPIDWDNVTKTNVNNAMYIRVASNNVFSSYVGGIVTNAPFIGWTGEVAVGQSFFVSSSGGGTTLTLKEADKTTNAFYFLRTKSPDNYFRIQLVSEIGQQDETVIHFVDDATDEIDSEFDAVKMKNGNYISPTLGKKAFMNIATYLEGADTEYSINSIAKLNGMRIVKLNIDEVTAGNYSLNFKDLTKMNLEYNIVLVDTYLNKEIDIADNLSYSFEVNSEIKSYGNLRFYLRINGTVAQPPVDREEEVLVNSIKVHPNPVSNELLIQLPAEVENNLRSIELHDIMGNIIVSATKKENLLVPGPKSIDMSSFANGVYVLYVRYGEVVKSTKIIKR